MFCRAKEIRFVRRDCVQKALTFTHSRWRREKTIVNVEILKIAGFQASANAIGQQRHFILIDPNAALFVDEVGEPIELLLIEAFELHGSVILRC